MTPKSDESQGERWPYGDPGTLKRAETPNSLNRLAGRPEQELPTEEEHQAALRLAAERLERVPVLFRGAFVFDGLEEAGIEEDERALADQFAAELEEHWRSHAEVGTYLESRPGFEGWTIRMSRQGSKDLHRLGATERSRIQFALDRLNQGEGDLCQLKGYREMSRLRVGDFRALLHIDKHEQLVTVVGIRSRGRAYG